MKRLKKYISNPRGFTLSEILMAVLIFSVLAAACYTIMASSSSSWQVNRYRIEVQQELRKSQDWMVSDLRQSGANTVTDVPADGAWYNTITFRTSTGVTGGAATWSANTIQFSLSGSQLRRISGSTTRVLAQNITSFQIRRQAATPNLVEVSLQAQKSVPSAAAIAGNLSFKVQLRN